MLEQVVSRKSTQEPCFNGSRAQNSRIDVDPALASPVRSRSKRRCIVVSLLLSASLHVTVFAICLSMTQSVGESEQSRSGHASAEVFTEAQLSPDPGDEITCIAAHPDGKLLALGHRGHVTLRFSNSLADWDAPDMVLALADRQAALVSLSFACDGNRLTGVCDNGDVVVWVRSKECSQIDYTFKASLNYDEQSANAKGRHSSELAKQHVEQHA